MSKIVNDENRIDESKPIVDEAQGVALVDQTPLEVVDAVESESTVVSPHAIKTMPDNSWTLDQMVRRKNLFANVVWPTTAAAGTVLGTWDLPLGILNTEITSLPFERFVFSKFDNVCIHANVIGNRLLQGMVMLVFVPTQRANVTFAGNLPSLQTLQNCHMYASQDTSVQMTIPFTFYKDWLELRQEESIGQLMLVVFNQYLGPAGSPTQLTVKLWSSFENAQFHVPRNDAAPPLRSGKSKEFVHVTRPLMRKNAGFLASMASAALGPIVSTIIPKVVNKVGDKLDNPNMGGAPDLITRKEQSWLSNVEGPEGAELLVAKPSTMQLVEAEHFNSHQNELDLNYILRNKLGFLTTVEVENTTGIGANIFNLRVGPNANTPWINQGLQNVTPIDFWSSKFTFWRGSIDFIVEAIMTPFHEARFDAVFQVDIDQPTPWDDAITQYYHSVVLRAEENCYRFRCPFFSSTPWKRIYWGEKPLSVDPEPSSLPFVDFYTGSFSLFLSNPLIAPSAVAPRIQLNIYQVAGSDFEFAGPNFYGSAMTGVAGGIPVSIARHRPIMKKNSGNLVDNKVNEDGKESQIPTFSINMPASQQPALVFGNNTMNSDFDNQHFGETTMDMNELLKRFTPFRRFQFDFPSQQPLLDDILSGRKPLVNVFDITNPTDATTWNGVESFVGSNYRNSRGPYTYKVRVSTSSAQAQSIQGISTNALHGWVTFIPYTSTIPTNIDQIQQLADQFPSDVANTFTQVQPRAFFSNLQTAEVKLPWYQHTKTTLIPKQFDNNVNLPFYHGDFESYRLVVAVFVDNLTTTDRIFADVDRAFGDERHFGVYIGQPQVQYTTDLYPNQPTA